MRLEEKESLTDRLKTELDKKEPDRDTVIQILKEVKKEEAGTEQADPVLEKYKKKPKKANTSSVWWKRLAVAAAICLVVLASVPNVFGCESLFTRIGQWTKDIFSFGEPKEKEFVYQTDHPGLQELYDTVSELGLSRNVVPTWIPEDAVLDQIYTREAPNGIMVYAGFSCTDGYIGIKVKELDEDVSSEYQKGEETAVLYETEGIKHYILENEGEWTATWVVSHAECMIYGNNEDVVYRMLKSIYLLEE